MIETHGLQKHFMVRGQRVAAVKGVDIEIRPGEMFGLLGPNGAGKTTTMRMLTTLLAPSGGAATVAGYDLLRQPQLVRRQIGYVGQAGGAQTVCTGRENLILQGRVCGLGRAEAQARANALLAAFSLSYLADRAAGTYSGGQRRRLDIALGMMHQPKLLFLDEPTTGLDPRSRNEVWGEVRRINAAGTTVFITTHYLDEADALCERLAIIDGGRVVAAGTPAELKRAVAHDTITLGIDQPLADMRRAQDLLSTQPFIQTLHEHDDELRLGVHHGEGVLPAVLRLLDSAEVRIRSIALAHPTLDDVFLAQTGRSLRQALP